MRARFTEYDVPGWGVGELWTGDGLVLAHEFRFETVSDTGAMAGSHASGRAMPEPASADEEIGRKEGFSLRGKIGTHSARLSLDEDRCLTPVSCDDLVERFRAFFAGGDASFADVCLDLSWATPFQRAVASALREIPRGEVVSYGELAALAGYPGAARAAGTFCARNRFMVIVPCHRVVGAHGIGGYGAAGPGTKRRLLALEGVVL